MRRKVLRRIVGKQMFGVVIVNRRAQIALGCGDRAIALCSVSRPIFVACGFIAPDATPVLPALDPAHQPLQIVRIHARRQIARRHVRKNQIDLRIARHRAQALAERRRLTALASRRPARSSRGSTSWMKYGMAAR
jgi:hypothetical protein